MDLSIPSVLVAIVSAVMWFYSGRKITREQELEKRRKLALASNTKPDLGGIEILDGDSQYDLIATLRHQSLWSRRAAAFTAIAVVLQAADKYV